MPVEHEEKIGPFKDDNFIFVVFGPDKLVAGAQNTVVLVEFEQGPIELKQESIPQITVLSQIPSPSTVMIRPVVALSREIHPFRVPELVAHKSEIALASQPHRDESKHLVQG